VEEYCNIAAKVQAELEEAMLFLVGRLYERARCPNLCLSGGVALNSVANGRIIREGPFKRIFITPAAGDGGVAVGAALYGHYHFTGQMPCPHFRNDFLGKPYADADMLTALQQNPCVEFELQVDPALAAARDIAQGKIVGWFEGRSEFGPRALGHRSILCDPRDADMKDILNARVKFRESFRPYAASILDESVSEFFDLHCPSPYMLVVADVLNSKRNVIPAVCHVDGTCRIQVVDNEYDGEYRCLVEKFGQLTGVPVVLNTSFNIRGEPIVESPQDALRCFLSTGIDVLYLGKYRVTKKSLGDPDTHTTASALVPYLSEQISLISVTQEQNGGWGEERLRVRIRTGRELPVSRAEYAVLRLVNGKLSVAAIEKLLFADPGTGHEYSVPDVFQRLQEKGLVSFRVR
jgi:carbamoyltransferase